MFDIKVGKVFLKRVEVPSVKLADLFVGAKVTIFSRVLTIVSYTDIATQAKQANDCERTFAMIKPCSYQNMGKIIDAVQQEGFAINKLKMSKFTKETSEIFYGEHIGKPFFPNLQEFITSDVVIGMELIAPNAIQKWRTFIGPTNTQKAKEEAPNSIRALFGTDGTKNAVHGSDSPQSAAREIQFFFGDGARGKNMPTSAVLSNCTLAIVKPHIIRNCQLGQVLDMILQSGFEISAAELFSLNRPQAEEFYDVYKGILPEYIPLIEHLSNGPTLMLEVRQEDAVK
jgi:nucleoside-diphosphate kinase